jgi:hypothetical protein
MWWGFWINPACCRGAFDHPAKIGKQLDQINKTIADAHSVKRVGRLDLFVLRKCLRILPGATRDFRRSSARHC